MSKEYRHLEDQIFDEQLVLNRIGYKMSGILAGKKAFKQLAEHYGQEPTTLFDKDSVAYTKTWFELEDWELTVYENDTLKPSEILFESQRVEKVKRYIPND